MDESGLAEAADDTRTDNDDDIEMKDSSDDVVIKTELKGPPSTIDPDDDDVMIMPSEDPVVTEILDETEVSEEKIGDELNAGDDDVMIQEPKIETQLVLDDDDDDYQPNPSTSVDLIVKIKEEPQDDGYEDLVNEEDAFVEVTAIANDDLNGEFFKKLKIFIICDQRF